MPRRDVVAKSLEVGRGVDESLLDEELCDRRERNEWFGMMIFRIGCCLKGRWPLPCQSIRAMYWSERGMTQNADRILVLTARRRTLLAESLHTRGAW